MSQFTPRHDIAAVGENEPTRPSDLSIVGDFSIPDVAGEALAIGELTSLILTASGIVGNLAYDAIETAVQRIIESRPGSELPLDRHLEIVAREAVRQRCRDLDAPPIDVGDMVFDHHRDTRYCYVQMTATNHRVHAEVRIPWVVVNGGAAQNPPRLKVTLYTNTIQP